MRWKYILPILLAPVIYLVIAFSLTAFAPQVETDTSLNFERLRGDNPQPAELQRFAARDGGTLSYAHYPADSDVKLVALIWRATALPMSTS